MTSPLDRIPRLAALLAETGLGTMDLSGPCGQVFLARRGPAPLAPTPAASAESPAVEAVRVASPGIGTFRRAHPLHEQPFVEEGDPVGAGQVLGLLQVGALLRPVRAPSDGIVAAIRAADGALTGFGDPLFDLLPH